MDYKAELQKIISNQLHGDGNYHQHCFGVYDILSSIGADIEVCKAGLFHSVYDSEYFSTNENISRNDIRNIIGVVSEDLVYKFCNIRNRFTCILDNSFKLNPYEDKALTQIEYANLKEQHQRNHDPKILEMSNMLMQKLSLYNLDFENYSINNKELYIFDNIFDDADVEYLNQYCLNSVYKPEHSSNDMNYDMDSRFVAMISPEELQNSKILPGLERVSNYLRKNLYIAYQYINHYTLNTSVSAHTDSSNPGEYTVLIFPNKYWQDTWGGEIVFFEKGNVHKLIQFVPGRVIVFDSRLSHKVLPLTRNARKDRYSIALKCCDYSAIDKFSKIYNIHTKVGENEF